MKNLILFLFLTVNLNTIAQTFYRSVADVDSFAYVTKNDKILVLKRDVMNELQLVNMIPFLTNHRQDGYNSSVIIGNYLIVCSADSIVLFSISNRENPTELHRIYENNIYLIDKFGNYLFIYVGNTTRLYKIENDSLKYCTEFNGGLHTPGYYTYGFYNDFAHSYPFIYSRYINNILVRKYIEETNQVDSVNIFDISNEYLVALLANSQNVFTIEGNWIGNGASMYHYKYDISDSTLINQIQQCFYFFGVPAVRDGKIVTEQFGLDGPTLRIYNVAISPCSLYSKNINFSFPAHYFMIKNSIYKIGSSSFYYLFEVNGDNLIFHQFIMPVIPSIPNLVYPINHQQVSPDTVNFSWYSSSPRLGSTI